MKVGGQFNLLLKTEKITKKKPDTKRKTEKVSESVSKKDESEIMNEILNEEISSVEFDEAINMILSTHSEASSDEISKLWSTIVEAHDIVIDQRRIKRGLKPIYSNLLRIPVTVITDTPKIKDPPLNSTFVVINRWETSTGENKSQVIAIINTVCQYWSFINSMAARDKEWYAQPLVGMGDKADSIFSELLTMGKKRREEKDIHDDIVDIDNRDSEVRKIVSNKVAEFNGCFSALYFGKVNADSKITDEIQIPFIVDSTGRKLNEININLKDIKANKMIGLSPIDHGFASGYIPLLLLDLIRGALPQQINGIMFSKTIAVNGSAYFRGFRLRVINKTKDYQLLLKTDKYLGHDFIKSCKKFNKKDYSKVEVRRILPKRT